MATSQRELKQKIGSTQTLKKVFRAMELIAASRIGKARDAAGDAEPFSKAVSKAVLAVSIHSNMDHPLTRERHDTKRVAVLAVTSDRGMAGAYSANILRETDKLMRELEEDGKEPVLYTFGRRAEAYFRFRGRHIERSWQGSSDNPDAATIAEISKVLQEVFLTKAERGGVAEVYLVFTRFKSMVSQVPEIRRMLPLRVVKNEEISEMDSESIWTRYNEDDVMPLYEFEPDPETVLGKVLPLYIHTRIRHALLQAAASELASRQTAMKTATDNAEDLIADYTRKANAARQMEITQEITEIVSGADALAG
ncbi:MAG: F0F1 ATP synthase subunit gamma [Actinomycetaceae bacterium]|nr:F0F1 ATP synthase subunit gamma [Actinomycetaceae bacterium]